MPVSNPESDQHRNVPRHVVISPEETNTPELRRPTSGEQATAIPLSEKSTPETEVFKDQKPLSLAAKNVIAMANHHLTGLLSLTALYETRSLQPSNTQQDLENAVQNLRTELTNRVIQYVDAVGRLTEDERYSPEVRELTDRFYDISWDIGVMKYELQPNFSEKVLSLLRSARSHAMAAADPDMYLNNHRAELKRASESDDVPKGSAT